MMIKGTDRYLRQQSNNIKGTDEYLRQPKKKKLRPQESRSHIYGFNIIQRLTTDEIKAF